MRIEIPNIKLESAAKISETIDVSQWGWASIQFIPDGAAASTAVVVAEIAHDARGRYRDSYSGSADLAMNGTAITEIDVADQAFLAFDVALGEGSELFGTIIVSLSQPLQGFYEERTFDLDSIGRLGDLDDRYSFYFIHGEYQEASPSAVIEVKRYLDPKYPLSDSPAKIVPTIGTVNVRRDPDFGLQFWCTTAESGQTISIFVYGRMDATLSVSPSPDDGDYLRRDGAVWEGTKNIAAEDGGASAPGITFANDLDCGIYRNGSDDWRMVVNSSPVIYLGTAGGGLFTTLVQDADLVTIGASISWIVTAPDAVLSNSSTSAGAKVSFREGSTNGSSEVEIQAPASLSASYTVEWWDSQPGDGHGIFFDASGKMNSSPFAASQAFAAELAGTVSTTSNSGFQWSFGGRAAGDGYGVLVPFNYEIIAVGISVRTNASGTCTIEIYKGADEDATSSGTGATVSLSSGEEENYVDYSSSPISGNAGDYLVPKTTAVSGSISNGRVVFYIRPR